MDDTLIDFNHIYYLLGDKLFKEQFSPSRDPFNFFQCYEALDFDFLKDDTSFFFLENSTPPLHEQLLHFLKQQGYIEDNKDSSLETKLTDKGVVAVEKGGIENFKSYRQRQEEIQIKIQESTLNTNLVSRITSIVTSIAVTTGLLISYWNYLSLKKYNEIQNKSYQIQINESNRDSMYLERKNQNIENETTNDKK